MNATKIGVVKIAVNLLVGMGVTKISSSIIANNVATETALQKVSVGSASIVIGMMAKDATKSYTNAQIDEAVDTYNKIKAQVKERQQEAK